MDIPATLIQLTNRSQIHAPYIRPQVSGAIYRTVGRVQAGSFIFLTLAVILLTCAVPEVGYAQECGGAAHYIIRDEEGVPQGREALRSMGFERSVEFGFSLPGNADNFERAWAVEIGEGCSNFPKGVTLHYGGKTMRLLTRGLLDENSRYLIDSLPFQEGTFELRVVGRGEGNGVLRDDHRGLCERRRIQIPETYPPCRDCWNRYAIDCFIPARRWERVETERPVRNGTSRN